MDGLLVFALGVSGFFLLTAIAAPVLVAVAATERVVWDYTKAICWCLAVTFLSFVEWQEEMTAKRTLRIVDKGYHRALHEARDPTKWCVCRRCVAERDAQDFGW